MFILIKKYFSLNKIYEYLFKFKILLIKRDQKYFFIYESLSKIIKLNNKIYFILNNYFFSDNSNIKKKFNLSANYRQVIFVVFSKYKKYFEYSLDNSTYKRLLHNSSFNFLKINLLKKKKIKIKDTYDFISRPIFIKNESKKKLVLLLMLDGYGNYFNKYLKNTNIYFDNFFSNAWSNAEWTLPSFSNLISGLRTSKHKCYKDLTYYSNYLNIPIYDKKISLKKKNIFEYFKDLDFITSCFSPYVRINPSYEFDRGVDVFKYCENYTAEQIIDNIISQLEFFKEGSNFIFAHIFDTHSPVKKYMEISDFSKHPDANYIYNDKQEKNHFNLKNAAKIKDEYETIDRISAFCNIDRKLTALYNYLDKSKYDDYTIILFGDHGTRLKEQIKNKNILSKNQNNIGMHLKDKKFKNLKYKDKIIEIIDILPSLLFRYNKKNFSQTEVLDGVNTLFSSFFKSHSISESIYSPYYQFNLRLNDINVLSKYEFINDKIGRLISEDFFDQDDNQIFENDIKNKKKYNILKKYQSCFLKKL